MDENSKGFLPSSAEHFIIATSWLAKALLVQAPAAAWVEAWLSTFLVSTRAIAKNATTRWQCAVELSVCPFSHFESTRMAEARIARVQRHLSAAPVAAADSSSAASSVWSAADGHRADPECNALLDALFPGSAALPDSDTRRSLAAAHLLLRQYRLDDLVWNHISGRITTAAAAAPAAAAAAATAGGGGEAEAEFLITPGCRMFEEVRPADLVRGSESENETGDVIHGAIFAARPDVGAVVHTHTPAIVAVCALAGGFSFLSQDSGRYFQRIATHPYEGISNARDERARIGAAVAAEQAPGAGMPVALLMENHGGVTVGRTVEEAWLRMYYLDVCCRTQLAAQAAGRTHELAPAQLLHLRAQFDSDYTDGRFEWTALLRRSLREVEADRR